jgi:hypothetical protein
MNRLELEQIEKKLNIQLPMSYKKLVAPLPVAQDRGSTHGWLWDDSKKIIEYNLYLRQEHNWPNHYFCVGEDGSGGQFLIDLREAETLVQRTEFENLSTLLPATFDDTLTPLPLVDWYSNYVLNLGNDSIEVNKPEIHEPTLPSSLFWMHRVTLIIFIVALLALIGVGITAIVFTFRSALVDLSMVILIIIGILVITGPILIWISRKRSSA